MDINNECDILGMLILILKMNGQCWNCQFEIVKINRYKFQLVRHELATKYITFTEQDRLKILQYALKINKMYKCFLDVSNMFCVIYIKATKLKTISQLCRFVSSKQLCDNYT